MNANNAEVFNYKEELSADPVSAIHGKAMSKAEAEQASLRVLGCLCGTYSVVKSQFLTAKSAMNAKVTQRFSTIRRS